MARVTMQISAAFPFRRPCDERRGRQTNKSVISLTSSRVNVNCTEIGRARHIVKRRLTALSFTTGLVIRISHDEAPRKPAAINSAAASLLHLAAEKKKKTKAGGMKRGWDQPNGSHKSPKYDKFLTNNSRFLAWTTSNRWSSAVRSVCV